MIKVDLLLRIILKHIRFFSNNLNYDKIIYGEININTYVMIYLLFIFVISKILLLIVIRYVQIIQTHDHGSADNRPISL